MMYLPSSVCLCSSVSLTLDPLRSLCHHPSVSPTAPQQPDIRQLRGAGTLALWILPLPFLLLLHPFQWHHLFCTKSQHHHHLHSHRKSQLLKLSLFFIWEEVGCLKIERFISFLNICFFFMLQDLKDYPVYPDPSLKAFEGATLRYASLKLK